MEKQKYQAPTISKREIGANVGILVGSHFDDTKKFESVTPKLDAGMQHTVGVSMYETFDSKNSFETTGWEE